MAALIDVPAIRALLARAYFDDPLTEWIFPDPTTRLDATAAWYGLYAEQYVTGAQATLVPSDGALSAMALWRRATDGHLSPDGVPSIAGLLAALVGTSRAEAIGAALHSIGSLVPTEPHVYLNFLAVSPHRQRSGLGRQAIEPVLAAADEDGQFVHLETTNPANYEFYERLGFVETGRVRLGEGGPELRAMRWDAG